MRKVNKLLLILGPTATGKSALAVDLALKFNGEIISADSRQVYKGMDLGTGKITRAEMQGVLHHCLDLRDPSQQFSAADYQALATKAITEVGSRSKLPILCGGTGQYIRVVTRGSELPAVPPNEELRQELETWDTDDLAAELERLDPERHEAIDLNNRRRLVRAIEIVEVLGKVPELKESAQFNTLMIGLALDNETQRERIHVRLLARLDAGMLQEVEKLHEGSDSNFGHPASKIEGLSWKRLESFGLEYKYCAQFLQKMLTREQMIQKLESEIWHYAKRQMTYFKKYFPETQWFLPAEREKIEDQVRDFIKE